MVIDMFTYNIAKEADNKAFKDVCAAIEAKVKGITKEKLLTDVDGSLIQTYNTQNGSIKVYNDYEVDAVYVDSEVDLSEVL